MKRVAIVVVVALLNAALFGVRGSAEALQPSQQDKETARRQMLLQDAKRIPPGAAIRVERLDGTKVEGLFDRVNDDGDLEMLQVLKNYRSTVIIQVPSVKSITLLRGRSLNAYSKRSGLSAGEIAGATAFAALIVFGLCAGAVKAGK